MDNQMVTCAYISKESEELQEKLDAEKWRKHGAEGVREHCEGYPVHIFKRRGVKNQYVIEAVNEGGYNGTLVNLNDVLGWVKKNKPELLEMTNDHKRIWSKRRDRRKEDNDAD